MTLAETFTPANESTPPRPTTNPHSLDIDPTNYRARYYSSNDARFLTPDPSGLMYAQLTNPQSLNLYNYVGNDPLSRVDLMGLCWKGFKWACDAGNGIKHFVVSAKNKIRYGEWTTNTTQAEIRSLDRYEAKHRQEEYQKETAGSGSQNAPPNSVSPILSLSLLPPDGDSLPSGHVIGPRYIPPPPDVTGSGTCFFAGSAVSGIHHIELANYYWKYYDVRLSSVPHQVLGGPGGKAIWQSTTQGSRSFGSNGADTGFGATALILQSAEETFNCLGGH